MVHPAEHRRGGQGGIDLDPASCEEANRTVRAARYYTRANDGLCRPWRGRIWLNPPYGWVDGKKGGVSNQAIWSRYLRDQYAAGTTEAAILLVNAMTGDQWFAPLWQHPICFVARRIRFLDQYGEAQGSPTHGAALVYFGARPKRFAQVFKEFGPVVLELARHG